MENKKREISPFLGVYKPQYTSIFSILERISGIIILLISIVFISLISISEVFFSNYTSYAIIFEMIKGNSIIIRGLLIFGIASLVYHYVFGLRFLFWDRTGGEGIDLSNIYKSSTLLVSIVGVISVLIAVLLY